MKWKYLTSLPFQNGIAKYITAHQSLQIGSTRTYYIIITSTQAGTPIRSIKRQEAAEWRDCISESDEDCNNASVMKSGAGDGKCGSVGTADDTRLLHLWLGEVKGHHTDKSAHSSSRLEGHLSWGKWKAVSSSKLCHETDPHPCYQGGDPGVLSGSEWRSL